MDKIFKSFEILVQFIITALKSITKLVKLQSLVAKEQRIKFFGREIFRQKNGWFPREWKRKRALIGTGRISLLLR